VTKQNVRIRIKCSAEQTVLFVVSEAHSVLTLAEADPANYSHPLLIVHIASCVADTATDIAVVAVFALSAQYGAMSVSAFAVLLGYLSGWYAWARDEITQLRVSWLWAALGIMPLGCLWTAVASMTLTANERATPYGTPQSTPFASPSATPRATPRSTPHGRYVIFDFFFSDI